jgi:hypothetical protein
MREQIIHVAAALLGASFQEITHWYELRGVLDHQKYQKLLGSSAYWLFTVLMIGAATIGTLLWLVDDPAAKVRDYFVYAAGLPLMLKKVMASARANRSEMVLGSGDSLGAYLGVGR